MKKYIYGSFLLLIVILGAYLSFSLCRNLLLSTNIENGHYSSCFNDPKNKKYHIEQWNKNDIFNIQFVESGNADCLAPKFPSIEVSSPEVTHWLHIVETSGDVQFSGKMRPWVTLDHTGSSLMSLAKSNVIVVIHSTVLVRCFEIILAGPRLPI